MERLFKIRSVFRSTIKGKNESNPEPGRMVELHYLDRYIPVTDWNML